MLEHIQLQEILFIDIETVPQYPHWSEMPAKWQQLWQYRIHRFQPEEQNDEDYYFEKAGVYAEFGRIICISVGVFTPKKQQESPRFRIKTFYGDDEKAVLAPFLELLSNFYPHRYRYLCGHNIKSFDVPFLCRRILIHGLSLPPMLNINRLKPWEFPFIDTMNLWRFGDYRNYTSLDLLTQVMHIPSPKEGMEGKEVAAAYWESKDMKAIKQYCEGDVLAVARLVQQFKGMEFVKDEGVEVVENG